MRLSPACATPGQKTITKGRRNTESSTRMPNKISWRGDMNRMKRKRIIGTRRAGGNKMSWRRVDIKFGQGVRTGKTQRKTYSARCNSSVRRPVDLLVKERIYLKDWGAHRRRSDCGLRGERPQRANVCAAS